MNRVAREAGISRAALYLHFDGKESLFRAVVADLHESAVRGARAALATSGTLAERFTRFFEAKSLRVFELLRNSEHAEEFLGLNHRLCGDISAAAVARTTTLLATALTAAERAGEIALRPSGMSARAAAELFFDTADGIKTRGREALSVEAYRRRLRQAIVVLVAGLAPEPARRRVATASRARSSSR
jgi:AcrR family transcriptional regulator